MSEFQPPYLGDTTQDIPLDADCGLAVGTAVGRFTLLGVLGTGGAGIVYSAYDPELDRRVAIKMLHASGSIGDSQPLIREAKAMARVSHPNVVSVYDVGAFEDRVFLALEYVEGEDIAQWLGSETRDWRSVLDVLQQAGEGLSAAHRAELVHRDFKPSNVLLSRDGRVLVTDFGIAERVRSDREETEHPRIVGTPAFMAPETLRGQPATPASDQFSFCVTAYCALFGVHPFAAERSQVSARILENAREDAPSGSQVPGRVLAVLNRGMSADPTERFPSMVELLAALGRDPSAARGRVVLAAGMVVAIGAVALVAGISRFESPELCSGYGARAHEIWNAESLQQMERAFVASGARDVSERLGIVREGFDGYVESWVTMQRENCVASEIEASQSPEVTRLRTRCLERRWKSFTALNSVMLEADANVVEQAATAAASLPAIDECGDIEFLLNEVPMPTEPELAALVEELGGEIEDARALLSTAQLEEATSMLEQTIATAQAANLPQPLVDAQLLLGRVHRELGDHEAALEAFERSVLRAEEVGDTSGELVAWSELGEQYGSRGRERRPADRAFAHAEAVATRRGGRARELGLINKARGWSALQQWRLEDAISYLKRAREHYARAGELFSRDRLSALSGLAGAEMRLGLLGAARRDYARLLELCNQHYGPHDSFTLTQLQNAATVDMEGGEYEAAVTKLLDAQQGWGDKSVFAALTAAHNLAETYRLAGRYDDAKRENQRSLRLAEELLEPDSPVRLILRRLTAEIATDAGEHEAALEELERLEAVQADRGDVSDSELAETLGLKARILAGSGRVQEAIERGERAFELLASAGSEVSPLAFRISNTLGELQLRRGSLAEARSHFKRVIEGFETVQSDPRYLAIAKIGWARASAHDRRYDAVQSAEEARGLIASRPHPPDERIIAGIDRWLTESAAQARARRGAP